MSIVDVRQTDNTVNAILLEQTSALTLNDGVANDTLFMGVVILHNAAAVTATIGGFDDEDGDAAPIVFTGNATAATPSDVSINFGGMGLINDGGAFTVTASVADKVLVMYKKA